MSKSKEIKAKIKSIKSTQKITSAMEMLSASKMKRSQNIMKNSRPFAANIIELIHNLAYNYNESHDFFKATQEINVGLIMIGTDRGLCGGLNINLFRKCLDWIKSLSCKNINTKIEIATIGGKAKIFSGTKFQSRIIASQEKIGENPTMQQLIGVIQVLLKEYKFHKIDSIYLAYNKFKNTMEQVPVIEKLLPIKLVQMVKPNKLPTEYLFEPNTKQQILDLLLERYIESLVYQGVVENIASEQSARMVAMKNATENAAKIMEDLNLNYNKERQMLITKEIAEIVSGSNSI